MLDRNSHVPLHVQIEMLLREKLDSEEWAPGQLIPSENELSAYFGVSRMTLRNVITKLVHEELLDRVPGKGTFVRQQKFAATPLSYAGIREQLEQKGYEVSTRLLSIHLQKGSPAICRKLNLDENALLYVIKRLRLIKNVPLSLHTSYIPANLCPGLDQKALESQQLCAILNDCYNLKAAKTEETLESAAATKDEAYLLAVPDGHPLLLLEDIIENAQGQAYEFSKVVFRGDKIVIHMSY